MAILSVDYKLLWDNIRNWSRKAGRSSTRPVLLMWYVMRSRHTPLKEKLAIFYSIAMLVMPLRVLKAKRLPVIGIVDGVISLATMIKKMARHITPEMRAKADAQLDKWFPAPQTPQSGRIEESGTVELDLIEE